VWRRCALGQESPMSSVLPSSLAASTGPNSSTRLGLGVSHRGPGMQGGAGRGHPADPVASHELTPTDERVATLVGTR
jgi:hypothetical protein